LLFYTACSLFLQSTNTFYLIGTAGSSVRYKSRVRPVRSVVERRVSGGCADRIAYCQTNGAMP